MTETDFTHATLPVLGHRVLRLGVAGNYGLQAPDVAWAAERGVNFWSWTARAKSVTATLRGLFPREREKHVVAMLGVAYTAGMVRAGVEKALRQLGTDYLDCYQLSWLGTGSLLTGSIQEALLALKEQGRIRSIGISIHDRPRAGRLARDSVIDLFMIRYNAAHPGAETDIFPHLPARNPALVCYTATSWGQLMKPLGLSMPPWPGAPNGAPVPPPLPASACYRFCLQEPRFHVVLTGPANREQLAANLDALAQGPLTPEETAWVREYGRKVRAKKRIPFL